MTDREKSGAIDSPFAVPFAHRLRFHARHLRRRSPGAGRLVGALRGRPARVQFWLDESLVNARARPAAFGSHFHATHAERIVPTGNVQFVPGGEVVKNDIHILERMLKVFNAADLDRRSYVVVIGGGAVLDAVGFAAAIAHRGIRLVRLPDDHARPGRLGRGREEQRQPVRQEELARHVRGALGRDQRCGIAGDAAAIATSSAASPKRSRSRCLKDRGHVRASLCDTARRIRRATGRPPRR